MEKRKMIKVENLKGIKASESILYSYNNYEIMIYRVNNDINGNPLYRIYLSENFESINEKLKGLVYKCYCNKGYSLIQSYDINKSLENIFEKLENELEKSLNNFKNKSLQEQKEEIKEILKNIK